MRLRLVPSLAAMMISLAPSAMSDEPIVPSRTELAERAARRFPQPVRVGALLDRRLLDPTPRQRVLGRVAGTSRANDGAVSLVVRTGDWLGFGGRTVAVPIEAVALLGEHVALIDLTPDQLRALPDHRSSAGAGIPAGDEIRIGLVKPFH